MKILVIEDDIDIQALLKEVLFAEGYEVLQAFTGVEGKLIAGYDDVNLILLDIMIPGIDGQSLLREFRTSGMKIPIIMMSAMPGYDIRVNTLRDGADDFIAKPFSVDELLARIEANLRRAGNFDDVVSDTISYKNLSYCYSDNTVRVNGEELHLTKKEQEIIVLLLENPNKIFSKENLYKSIWKEDYAYDDNTINVHISKLRAKIQQLDSDEDYLKTIWGMGYRLKAD